MENEIRCKRCNSKNYYKNGFVRGKQRYKCKDCVYNFTNTPKRGVPAPLKALAILLYSTGRASYHFIARLLNVSPVAVYKWIKKEAIRIPEPKIEIDLNDELSMDEMWHFIKGKLKKDGSSKYTVLSSEKLLVGSLVIVIQKQ